MASPRARRRCGLSLHDVWEVETPLPPGTTLEQWVAAAQGDNRTVSAFLHASLADRHPRLAVYVRPKGRLGRTYLRVIEPFRRRVVYPHLLAAGARAAARLQAGKPSCPAIRGRARDEPAVAEARGRTPDAIDCKE